MRIRAITPIHIGPEELARHQARYDRLAPAPLRVELVDLDPGAPRALETAADVAASDALVAAAARTADPGSVDVVLPDCVLDPGADAADDGPIAVAGLLRLTAGFLHARGRPFAHVTRNAAIRDELERRLAGYGYAGLCRGHAVLDLGFEAIAGEGEWEAALHDALPALGARGAEVVINGCSAVALGARTDPPAIDPTALALELLAFEATSTHAGARARTTA
jgi:Asp/Glu/hydantoin racemase